MAFLKLNHCASGSIMQCWGNVLQVAVSICSKLPSCIWCCFFPYSCDLWHAVKLIPWLEQGYMAQHDENKTLFNSEDGHVNTSTTNRKGKSISRIWIYIKEDKLSLLSQWQGANGINLPPWFYITTSTLVLLLPVAQQKWYPNKLWQGKVHIIEPIHSVHSGHHGHFINNPLKKH